MNHQLPQPNTVGIAKTKELYLNKYKRVLTDAEAAEILGKAMRYLYLVGTTCLNTESTPENLMTTSR